MTTTSLNMDSVTSDPAFAGLTSSSVRPLPSGALRNRTLYFGCDDSTLSGLIYFTKDVSYINSTASSVGATIYISFISAADPGGYVYCSSCSPPGYLRMYNNYIIVVSSNQAGSNTFSWSYGKLNYWTPEGVQQEWCIDENAALRSYPPGLAGASNCVSGSVTVE